MEILESDGTLTTTRSFSKYIASGDYTINTIRLYDNAGNDGWVYGRDLPPLGVSSILTLDKDGDEVLPELLSFGLEANFHPVSLRPSIFFDFVATDSGTGYKNAYIRISDSNGLNNDRWIDLDADPFESGVQFLLDLTSEYTPGRFSIDFFNLYDKAGMRTHFPRTICCLPVMKVNSMFSLTRKRCE